MRGFNRQGATGQRSVTVAIALGSAALVAIGADARAAATMTGSNSISGESWLTPGDWSDNAAAHAGEDYIVGLNGSSPRTVRTPASSGPIIFPGNSLTLAGGQLNLTADGDKINGLQPGPYNTNTTIGTLAVHSGGVIVNAVNSVVNGDTQFLHGSLSFSGATTNYIRTGGSSTQARNINVDALISGSGNVGLLQRGTITLGGDEAINATDNTFSGTWILGGTNVTVGGATISNAANQVTLVKAAGDGSLGNNSSVTINAHARLDVDYDWETVGSLTLNTSGVMLLDQDITVGALTIGGVSLTDGTYSFASLNSSYDAFFDNAGSGSITVGVPEPAGALVLVVGMLSLVRRRRAE